jgi:hypothetical protein
VPSPSLLLPTEEQAAALELARRRIADAEAALAAAIADGESHFAEWLAKPQALEAADLLVHFSFDGGLGRVQNEIRNSSGTKFSGKAAGLPNVDGVRGNAVRFDGDHGAVFPDVLQVDRWDPFTLDFWLRDIAGNPLPVVVLQRTFGTDVGYNGFDLMLTGGTLEARFYRVWPGNAIGVRAARPIAPGEWQHITITYDGSSTARGLRLFLNGRELATTVSRNGLLKTASIATHGSGHFTLGERFRDRGFRDGEIDELRIFDRAVSPLEIRNLHDGSTLDTALKDPQSNRDELAEYYFSAVDTTVREAARQLRAARRKFVEAEEPVQEIPVMAELPEPRPTYILARGAYDAPKSDANRVGRDTFSDFLIPFPADAPRNRLGLARWLTDPRHPLTARVFVNRLWANFFGRPLVATPENFGRQGEAPTHPELLDWLARDFVDHNWNIKRLCRNIVLSATYRQDSRCPPSLRQRDPENTLLARGPSRRLSAEQIRDLALAASGLLDRRTGGPPVSPYQPGGDLWRETNTMSPAYQQSTGRDLHRRSLYSVWKRTTPLPNMLTFDAPTREACTVFRGRTNTPLQALVLLNDVQFVESARALAVSVSRADDTRTDQIRDAFLRLTGRQPDPTEVDLLEKLYAEQRMRFADASQQGPDRFVEVGEWKAETKLPAADLAALTVMCQAILNLDATIYER